MGKIDAAINKAGVENKREMSANADPVSSTVEEIENEQPILSPDSALIDHRQGWDNRLLMTVDNYEGVAESFRRLRAQILHPAEGKPARSVMITSAVAGEGKSFVCANLGVVMAREVERYALMVDCDLRRPSLASFFGVHNSRGLVDHLRDGKDLSRLLHKTGMDRLSLLPAGMPPANPSELLASDRMKEMVKEVCGRYDDRFILFDTPPGQDASETAVLAQQVDKVVLVVRWGQAGREQVRRFVEAVGREKMLGVVFNAFEMTALDTRLRGEGYYNYYSEGY